PDHLLRYLRGDASLAERRAVAVWTDADPAHRSALDDVLRQVALGQIGTRGLAAWRRLPRPALRRSAVPDSSRT
ncbi:MAG: hypothetical protein AAF594_10310, partial [Bacteroidota bacterium]